MAMSPVSVVRVDSEACTQHQKVLCKGGWRVCVCVCVCVCVYVCACMHTVAFMC